MEVLQLFMFTLKQASYLLKNSLEDQGKQLYIPIT